MTNEKVQWLILGLVVIGFIGFGGFMMKQDAQLDRVSNAVVALSSNIQALSQRQTASAPSAQPSIGSAPAVQPPSSQVAGQIRATCGDFPRSSGDGGPTSRYSVCLNVQNQTCYLKKDYQKIVAENIEEKLALLKKFNQELNKNIKLLDTSSDEASCSYFTESLIQKSMFFIQKHQDIITFQGLPSCYKA